VNLKIFSLKALMLQFLEINIIGGVESFVFTKALKNKKKNDFQLLCFAEIDILVMKYYIIL